MSVYNSVQAQSDPVSQPVGGELTGVVVVADRVGTGCFGRLDDRLGAVLMLCQHVRALIEQGLGGLGLLGRVTPVGGRHGDHRDVGVDRLGTQREGVDVLQRLGDRERIDVTHRVGLGGRPAAMPAR